ncbi:CSL zinc finger protein [Cercophora scortea]|uniref:Diphthamide biosynthesis protein 4 n=1 Tax=Cercophora scortea TaxID=314031 RepID=A0AAE0J6R8_9PEZI|nr:CSL zinc finger protein [Cercophora scortea]
MSPIPSFLSPQGPLEPPQPTYYDILGISPAAITTHSKGPNQSPPDQNQDKTHAFIKRAYRRSLLSHHPDKLKLSKSSIPPHHTSPSPAPATKPDTITAYTIDQISTAYAVLSSPSQRAEYDKSLRLQRQQQQTSSGNGLTNTAQLFQTGIENVDLDDLDVEESSQGEQQWYRSCRCGNPRGYLFGEADLEEASDLGELMVGCADCSLWLRVHFAVVDDDDDDDDNDDINTEPIAGDHQRARDNV